MLEVCASHFFAATSGLESIAIITVTHAPQSNGTSLRSTSLYTSTAIASLGCTRTVWTTSTSTAARGDKRFFRVCFGITLLHITRATLSMVAKLLVGYDGSHEHRLQNQASSVVRRGR